MTTETRTAAEKPDHARGNAAAWMDSILEYIAALDCCGDEQAEEARERIMESALEVSVRSGWYSPGSEPEPEEFRILLTYGGPSLQIRGELDEHNEPSRAWLEYRDWGTPWTEYHGENSDQAALLTFARCFYFGE